ncbi:MAG TPA: caspase family protein, partial [Nitrosomonas sp.]|nr:caspase family protein [Nitrosomonas sp.]
IMRYAVLIIGIYHYKNVPPLRTTYDAEDIANLFAEMSLAYPFSSQTLLLDTQATELAIINALDALAGETDENTLVFIYFAGHGVRAAQPGRFWYYLLPFDGKADDLTQLEGSAISMEKFSNKLGAINALQWVLVLDCCKAGSIAEHLSRSLPKENNRNWAILAATTGDSNSYALPHRRHSCFTQYLLEGLSGRAIDQSGTVRIMNLIDYIQRNIQQEPILQQPVLKARLHQNFVLKHCM